MTSYRAKIASCFRKVSLGKYNTMFFRSDGTNYYSSVTGGIITILVTIILSTIAIVMIVDTLDVDFFHEDVSFRMLTTNDYNKCP